MDVERQGACVFVAPHVLEAGRGIEGPIRRLVRVRVDVRVIRRAREALGECGTRVSHSTTISGQQDLRVGDVPHDGVREAVTAVPVFAVRRAVVRAHDAERRASRAQGLHERR